LRQIVGQRFFTFGHPEIEFFEFSLILATLSYNTENLKSIG